VGVSAAENMRFPVMGDVRTLHHARAAAPPLHLNTSAHAHGAWAAHLTRETRHCVCCAHCPRGGRQLMMSQQTIFVDREDRNSATKAADLIVRVHPL
jgi:hypothetical protein